MNKIQVSSLVTARLMKDGSAVQIEMDGYIGFIKDTGVLVLEVNAMGGNSTPVFTIDGPSRDIQMVGKGGVCTKRIRIQNFGKEGKAPTFVTEKDNYLMVAVLSPEGVVTVHVIAVIIQHGHMFVVHQLTHQVQAYMSGGGIVCPDLERKFGGWSSLAVLIAEKYKNNKGLRTIAEFVPHRYDLSPLKDDEVVVTVWSARRGSGGGVDKDGKGVGLFWVDIVHTEPKVPRILTVGEIVKVARFEKPNRMTQFPRDGRGIRRTEEFAVMVEDYEQDPATSSNIAEKGKRPFARTVGNIAESAAV